MAFVNPRGRVNYEPNSWNSAAGGPRESPKLGFRSFAAEESGPKLRVRAESFADHYSQARQFYVSQTAVEQEHIAAAFTFELSKVATLAIRQRMVGHLRNVHEDLARTVARRLGLVELPKAADAVRPPRQDLRKSPALSILLNGPDSLKGRKVGVLITDGVRPDLLAALKDALDAEGAVMAAIAPAVGGVTASDGSTIPADFTIEGGPSVLFDAVAILPSADGGERLALDPAARDFAANAFAHAKFIAYTAEATPLFEKSGILEDVDDGCIEIAALADFARFVTEARKLRYWARGAEAPAGS